LKWESPLSFDVTGAGVDEYAKQLSCPASSLVFRPALSFVRLFFSAPVDRMVARTFFEGHTEDDEEDGPGHHQDAGKQVKRQSGNHRRFLAKVTEVAFVNGYR
jgi:hypothetical protein